MIHTNTPYIPRKEENILTSPLYKIIYGQFPEKQIQR